MHTNPAHYTHHPPPGVIVHLQIHSYAVKKLVPAAGVRLSLGLPVFQPPPVKLLEGFFLVGWRNAKGLLS